MLPTREVVRIQSLSLHIVDDERADHEVSFKSLATPDLPESREAVEMSVLREVEGVC